MDKIKSIISNIVYWMDASFYNLRRIVNKIMSWCFKYGKFMVIMGVGIMIGYISTSIGLPCSQNQSVITESLEVAE